MNILEHFVKEHYQNAIKLKERFKSIEDKPWDSLTVMAELNVQIGHVFTVLKDCQGLIEPGRAINNLGDEISDVLLQLSYLAYLEGVTFLLSILLNTLSSMNKDVKLFCSISSKSSWLCFIRSI